MIEDKTWTERLIQLGFVLAMAVAFKAWEKWQYRASVNDARAELLYKSADSKFIDNWRKRVKAEHNA